MPSEEYAAAAAAGIKLIYFMNMHCYYNVLVLCGAQNAVSQNAYSGLTLQFSIKGIRSIMNRIGTLLSVQNSYHVRSRSRKHSRVLYLFCIRNSSLMSVQFSAIFTYVRVVTTPLAQVTSSDTLHKHLYYVCCANKWQMNKNT